MENTTTKIKWDTNNLIKDFQMSLCPFGYLDIKAAIEFLEEFTEDYRQDPATILKDAMDEYMDSVGETRIDNIDITAIAYDHVQQKARSEFYEIFGGGVDLEDFVWVAGNYCATSWDGKLEELKEFIKEHGKEKEVNETKYLSYILNSF